MTTPFKKGLISAAFIGSVLLPAVPAFAQTYTTTAAVSATVCSPLNYNLYYGVQGSDVSVLQSFLAAQGYFPYAPIGIYGPLTFQAVQRFQAARGISATGYTGPLTRAVINSLQNCSQPTPIPPTNTAPYIQSVYPPSGPVGTTVTISGYGFLGNNSVSFGGSALSTVYSSNGSSLTFTIPQYITPNCGVGMVCALWARLVTAGTYPIYIQNQNGTSNTVNFTVTDQTTSQPLSITGIDAPATIRVGETGTWTVRTTLGTYTPGSNVSYSVVWGDEAYADLGGTMTASQPAQTSATFTHGFVRPGTYTPRFTVTNSLGQTSSASVTLTVTY